jgi:hypothetical protein
MGDVIQFPIPEKSDKDPVTRRSDRDARIEVLLRRLWPEHYARQAAPAESLQGNDPVTRLARLSDFVWSRLPESARQAAEEAQR